MQAGCEAASGVPAQSGLEQLAREVDERLASLRAALEALPGEQRRSAMRGIHDAAPAVVGLINPFYGRLAAGS